MWQIYFIESGKTFYWTTKKCFEEFGEDEFVEYAQGYLPHVVVSAQDGDAEDYLKKIGVL